MPCSARVGTASISHRMLALGIDQSVKNSGVCILDDTGKVVLLQRVTPPKTLRNEQRLKYIYDSLQVIVDKHPGITVACMEGYSYGSLNKPFLLGEVGAAVKLIVANNNIKLLEAAPKQLKRFATGHGSADKDQVQISIKSKWGEDILQNDESDAYVLARITYTSLHKNSVDRSELEIIKKITSKGLHKPKPKRRFTSPRFSL